MLSKKTELPSTVEGILLNDKIKKLLDERREDVQNIRAIVVITLDKRNCINAYRGGIIGVIGAVGLTEHGKQLFLNER